jgi:hypothetical protein
MRFKLFCRFSRGSYLRRSSNSNGIGTGTDTGAIISIAVATVGAASTMKIILAGAAGALHNQKRRYQTTGNRLYDPIKERKIDTAEIRNAFVKSKESSGEWIRRKGLGAQTNMAQ